MKSFLEELSDIPIPKKRLDMLARGKNIVESSINFFSFVREELGEEHAEILLKKFILSIKKESPEKFIKKIEQMINEKK